MRTRPEVLADLINLFIGLTVQNLEVVDVTGSLHNRLLYRGLGFQQGKIFLKLTFLTQQLMVLLLFLGSKPSLLFAFLFEFGYFLEERVYF